VVELVQKIDMPSWGPGSFFREGEKLTPVHWEEWVENLRNYTWKSENVRVFSQGRSFFTTSKVYIGIESPLSKARDKVYASKMQEFLSSCEKMQRGSA
jgi:hypothetical protein